MTSISLSELARLLDGQLCGNGELAITGADTIREATAGQITLADDPKLAKELASSRAAAVLVPNHFRPQGIAFIQVADVHRAFARVVQLFRPQHSDHRIGVAATAVISPTAKLAARVTVHALAVIGDEVEIGEGATIHSGVQIMAGCKIGPHTTIFPNVVLYEDTIVGARCLIHSGTIIGAYGFGYQTIGGRHQLSAQLGFVQIGDDVELGAGTTIDRGTYGATVIGDGTKVDNQVQIAHNCHIGRHNLICSQVGIAGSATTGDYVVLAGQVGVRDHVHIGDAAKIGAKGGVMSDVPPKCVYVGIPATPEREQFVMQAALLKLPQMKKQIRDMQHILEALEPLAASAASAVAATTLPAGSVRAKQAEAA